MATKALVKVINPRNVSPACLSVSTCVIITAGCKTQVRIVNSAIVTPLEDLINDLRLRTCPRNATNTETKDSSIVFAKSANITEAVSGDRLPPDCILRPYRGCRKATISHIPEKTVEYTERMRIEIESQFFREQWMSRFEGQPSWRSGLVSILQKC